MIELLVSRDYDGMRLDRYIQKAAGLGRNTAEKLLRKGEEIGRASCRERV